MSSIRSELITASAASSNSASTTSTAPPPGARQPPPPMRFDPSRGGHRANGRTEKPLSADTAAKVKAAALAKVPGTVERVENDADHGSPYEAHVRKADGSEVEVLVNSDFKVTAVNSMMGHP